MVERKWRPNTRPQDVRVGKYFMLSDFLYSHTAVVRGIPNCPSSYTGSEVKGIKGLCQHILDPVVDRFGSVSVTFGFCSLALWHHWYPSTEGTEPTSLHLFRPPQGGIGGACDILIHAHKDPRPVFNWIRQNCVYDRLIIYPGSSIICVAWCEEKPRYHAKEWVFPENGGKAEYVNAGWDKPPVIRKESEIEQTSLFDLLNQPQDCLSFLLSPNANLLSLIHQ